MESESKLMVQQQQNDAAYATKANNSQKNTLHHSKNSTGVDEEAESEAAPNSGSSSIKSGPKPQAVAARANNTTSADTSNKGKITHRSQSSPSSLTTHKFGLRPTPSPPRLIIDHNTGDIIESYPDQPIYLKTYQPLEDYDNDDSRIDDCTTLDDSLAHPYPPPFCNQGQLDDYNRLLAEQYGQPSGDYVPSEQLAASMNQQQANRNSYRPVIPPPHSASNKVYFAPPVSSAGHLFHNVPQQQQQPHSTVASLDGPYDSDRQQHQLEGGSYRPPHAAGGATSGGQQPTIEPNNRVSGSHNNSFKRALNKLHEAANTDIAIMTDLPEYEQKAEQQHQLGRSNPAGSRASSSANPTGGGFRVTATSASKGNALLAQKSKSTQQQQQQQLRTLKQQPAAHRIVPAIEDFNLYDCFFNFRFLLACLLSTLIIYLLAYPLNTDCTQYRPTYTYVSIIVSSVNLTCIIIFTLFWYCNGVTRTLYANLSSSAFIITIYSILVAINLALAILFFFINTCHFQRLIKTSSPLVAISVSAATPAAVASTTESISDPMALPLMNDIRTQRISDSMLEALVAREELATSGSEFEPNQQQDSYLLPRRRRRWDASKGSESIQRQQQQQQITERHSNQRVLVPFSPDSSSDSTQDKGRANSGARYHGSSRFNDGGSNKHSSSSSSSVDLTESTFVGGQRAAYATRSTLPNSRFRRRPDEETDETADGNGQQQEHSLDGNLPRNNGFPHHHQSGQVLGHEPPPPPIDYYSESPLEVAWEYVKEQLALFRRKFYHFLVQYDLRFIGALHALCAICLQYMAMKVAVGTD